MIEYLDQVIEEFGKDQSSFWKLTVDTMNEALFIISPDRRLLYLNARAEDLIGRRREDVEGVACMEAIQCPNCECYCRLFQEGEMTNFPVTISSPRYAEPRVMLKNARILRDEAGRVIGGVETLKDISEEVSERTEKERHLERLKHEMSRMETLLGSLSEGVFTVGPGLRIRDFSRRMEEITGYKLEEARGEKMCDIFGAQTPFEECGSPTELVDRTMRVETRTKDGRQRPLEISFRAIGSRSDEIMGVVSDLFRFYDEIRAVENAFSFHGMISGSPSMREVFRQIDMAAGSDINVLVCGESGTGKELVARAIHNLSARRNRPFYAVNCATFTGGLLLSELFGHERGAFTGAVRTRPGKLEMAGDGTLFLDEVSEIPLQHQSLLLRVLEQRLFERVGGQSSIEMNARIIAATNRDLNTAVSEGRFREDLHYRLKVFPIRVPPLRERPEDIEILANYFLKRTAVARNDRLKALSPETLADLAAYPWPGNVRELRNMIEYLYFVSEEEILPKNLPSDFRKALNRGTAAPNEDEPLVDVGAAGEKTRIAEAMEKARYKRKVAAEMLGMDRTTLWRKLRKYGLEE